MSASAAYPYSAARALDCGVDPFGSIGAHDQPSGPKHADSEQRAPDSADAHRHAVSPTSLAASSSSSSSLNQFNSLNGPPSSVASASSTCSTVSTCSSLASHSASYSASSRLSSTCVGRSKLRHRCSLTPTQRVDDLDFESYGHYAQPAHEPDAFATHSLEPKTIKSYKTCSEYVEAMKEDLAEWLNQLYPDLDLNPDTFFQQLENGAIICRHANHVTRMGRKFASTHHEADSSQKTNCHERTNNSISTIGAKHTGATSRIPTIKPMLTPSKSYHCLSLVGNNKTNSPPRSNQPSANNVSAMLNKFNRSVDWSKIKILPFKQDAKSGTFFARDNICQFILWCRSLNILDCLLFETDDLVARKNVKSFILCLLEVARIGCKVGVPTPLIIQLEQEIDKEIENDAKMLDDFQNKQTHPEVCGDHYKIVEDKPHDEENVDQDEEEKDYGPKPQLITNDLMSLHEKVVILLRQCTCPTQFPMVRVGDNGKYKVGDKLIIFVRILRRHIMVRVGGGWQELSEFLRAKDPCRARHYQSSNGQANQASAKKSTPNIMANSRFADGCHHPNKTHHHQYQNYSGQRLISGSASMSWLSHNS